MENGPEIYAESLEKEIILLGENLAQKDLTIEDLNVDIENLNINIEDLNIKIEDLQFQIAQFKRMLFGSKRERFESNQNPDQLALAFDIEPEKIEAEIEKEKVSYERAKSRKQHPGREALPSHLPVVEIVLEPSEDVSGMTCIGSEITDELEYTPAKLHINRYIRPKYISKEDKNESQKQVIAELDRPMPKCIAGPDLLANIVVEKYVYHLPIYRQLQRFI